MYQLKICMENLRAISNIATSHLLTYLFNDSSDLWPLSSMGSTFSQYKSHVCSQDSLYKAFTISKTTHFIVKCVLYFAPRGTWWCDKEKHDLPRGSNKNGRKAKDLQRKMKIINDYEDGEKLKWEHFTWNQTAAWTILKDKGRVKVALKAST